MAYSQRGLTSYVEYNLLRGLVALNVMFVNDAAILSRGGGITDERAAKGSFVTTTYRVIVAPFSPLIFAVLGSLTLAWSIIICGVNTMSQEPAPNSSSFAEIDIMSRASQCPGIEQVLLGLGNATDKEIECKMRGKRVYVGATNGGMDKSRVIIGTEGGLRRLKVGTPYY